MRTTIMSNHTGSRSPDVGCSRRIKSADAPPRTHARPAADCTSAGASTVHARSLRRLWGAGRQRHLDLRQRLQQSQRTLPPRVG